MVKVVAVAKEDKNIDEVDILIPHTKKNQIMAILQKIKEVKQATNQMFNVIDVKNMHIIEMNVTPRCKMSPYNIQILLMLKRTWCLHAN